MKPTQEGSDQDYPTTQSHCFLTQTKRSPIHEAFILRHVTVIDGDEALLSVRDVLVKQGTIRKVTEPRSRAWCYPPSE
jgi:hypothetical protein